MKVDIEHYEVESGFFRKVTHYGVALTVQFNETEKHIIKTKNLGDYVILQRPPLTILNNEPSDYDHLHVNDLLKGERNRHTFATPIEARNYEEQLKEALPQLKRFIDGNSDIVPAEKKTSFEL